jgi:hypothetical protein
MCACENRLLNMKLTRRVTGHRCAMKVKPIQVQVPVLVPPDPDHRATLQAVLEQPVPMKVIQVVDQASR